MDKKKTRVQIEVRMSELREQLAKAAKPGDDETPEAHAERRDGIINELAALEPEHRQAMVDEAADASMTAGRVSERPVESREDRERRELRSKVTMANYLGAAVEMRATNGAEAEYNSELGLGANQFPLDVLAPDPVEKRATTNVESEVHQGMWLDRLFAGTAASALGITMRSVPTGVSSVPLTTAGASFAMKEREDAVGDAPWTVGVTECKPKRGAVRAVFTIEDAARLPGLEDALRRDLRMALTEGVDRSIFIGADGGAGNTADITGLTTAGIDEATLKQADKVKGEMVLAAFADLVDGIHANDFSDLRTVLTVGAWRLWATTITNAAAENQTVAQFLRAAGLSYTSRGEIETATTSGKFGGFVGLGRGMEGAGVAAMWEAGELIRDVYSGAAKGEVAITLNYLWDLKLPRPASFRRIKFAA